MRGVGVGKDDHNEREGEVEHQEKRSGEVQDGNEVDRKLYCREDSSEGARV